MVRASGKGCVDDRPQGYHFSAISGNLECPGIWLRSEKSQGKAQGQGTVREFVWSGKFDCSGSTN